MSISGEEHALSETTAQSPADAVLQEMEEAGERLLAALQAEAEIARRRAEKPNDPTIARRWVECRRASQELERAYESLVWGRKVHPPAAPSLSNRPLPEGC